MAGGGGGDDANRSSPSFDPRPYVVLDTNALLLSGNGGIGLSRYAKIGGGKGGGLGGGGVGGGGGDSDVGNASTNSAAADSTATATLLTTRAALAEVRDAASREALERLRGTGVCELVLREPEDEDVKAG